MESHSKSSASGNVGEEIKPDEKLEKDVEIAARRQMELAAKTMEGTHEIIVQAQATLKNLPNGFERGLNQVAKMFWVQFWLGIVLLLSSIVFQIFGFDILTYVFGATGGLVLITTFITSSPIKLQKNRVDLAQWGIAYFNWFNTVVATSGFLTAALQSGALTWEMFKESQEFLLENTERTLRNMEELCEFTKENGAEKSAFGNPADGRTGPV